MGLKFLKKGTKAHQALEQDKQEVEQKIAQSSIRRFYLPVGAETQITFLDGDLTDDGLLDMTSYREHQLKLNGHWRNWFTCIAENEPCPICIGGDSASLVSLFTVIDHSKWEDKQGNTHQNERRLFACKRDTVLRLQKYAEKRKGLAGCTFDVSRIGDKSPNTGSDYDFLVKQPLSDIQEKMKLAPEDVKPYVYEDIIVYRDANALRSMGFGVSSIGAADVGAQTSTNAYDQNL